jgi:O-antigen/teichoic acid export membrane protein
MKNGRDSATKRISATLLISVMAMAINYIISFLLTPYITTNVGTEAYGFVTLAKTISNYGIIITGCLNAYAARYITISYHEGNVKKANQYYSSVVLANFGLLIAVILFEVFFIWKLELFVRIPTELVTDVKILFALDITNYMLLAVANTFTASAYIKNRLDRVELIKLISYLTEAFILLLLFRFLSPKIFYVGIGLVISTCVLGLCNFRLTRKYTPELKIDGKSFSWMAVKDLVVSGIWNSINSVGNLLNSGLDLWVSNLMLSAVSMGELSIVKTVSTIFSTLEQLMSRPFQPYLLKRYSEKDIEGVVKVLKLEIKFSGYIVNMVCAGFIVFGSAYYKLWTPNQNIELLYGITIVTIVGFLFEGIAQPLFYTYTLTLKNKIPCYVTILSGLLNVLGMYVLLKYTRLELYAVVGTTTVLEFGTFMIFTPLYSAHCLGVKWSTFYPSMLRVIAAEVVIIGALRVVFNNYLPSSWLGLILCALVCCLIGLPIHVLVTFNRSELKVLYIRLRRR